MMSKPFPSGLNLAISQILHYEAAQPSLVEKPFTLKRARCDFCSWKKDRKTTFLCQHCKKNICGKHKIEIGVINKKINIYTSKGRFTHFNPEIKEFINDKVIFSTIGCT